MLTRFNIENCVERRTLYRYLQENENRAIRTRAPISLYSFVYCHIIRVCVCSLWPGLCDIRGKVSTIPINVSSNKCQYGIVNDTTVTTHLPRTDGRATI